MSTKNDLMVRLLLNTNGFDTNIQRSTNQIKSFQDNCRKMGDTISSFSSGLGINIGQLTKFGTAAGVAAAAGKVLSDAFMASETNADKFRSAMEQSKAAYNQFLISLNTGSWRNFFDNIKSAINDAKELYELFDTAGSTKANNRVAIAVLENAIAKIRQRLRVEKNLTKEKREQLQLELQEKQSRVEALKSEGTTASRKANYQGMVDVIQGRYRTTTGKPLNRKDLDKYINLALTEGQKFFNEQASIYDELTKKGTKLTQVQVGTTSAGIPIYEDKPKMLFSINNLSTADQVRYALAEAFKNTESDFQKYSDAYASAIEEDTNAINAATQNLKLANKEITTKATKVAPTPNEKTPYDANKKFTKEDVFKFLQDETGVNANELSEEMQESVYNAYMRLIGSIDLAFSKQQAGILSNEQYQSIRQKAYETLGDSLTDMRLYEGGKNAYRYGGKIGIDEQLKKLTNTDNPNLYYYDDKTNREILYEFESERNKLVDGLTDIMNTANVIGIDETVFQSDIDAVNELINGLDEVIEKRKEFIKIEDNFSSIANLANQIGYGLSSVGVEFEKAGETGAAFALKTASELSNLLAQIANMVVVDSLTGAAKLPYPANIAAIVSTVATVASIVGSAMNTFANGGIVQGSGSGWSDSVPALVSNGEMILNRRQQGNLFALLDGNRVSNNSIGGDVKFRLQGRELIGLINNETKKQNKVL